MMGTNYYHHETPPCETCRREDEPRHVGKSSAGWCFSLHVYPDEGIRDLPDWQARWARGLLRDEYGRPVTPEDMLAVITIRFGYAGTPAPDPTWLRQNHAVAGPHSLARYRIDDRCIGHGDGPYDLMVGEFS